MGFLSLLVAASITLPPGAALLVGKYDPQIDCQDQYAMSVDSGWWSRSFSYHRSDDPEGRVVKRSLSVQTCYDLYDSNEQFIAYGIRRLSGLGLLYDWATEIEILNVKNEKIGGIRGVVLGHNLIEFELIDAANQCIGVATLDRVFSNFWVSPGTDDSLKFQRRIAFLERDDGKGLRWQVYNYDVEKLDSRLLRIFGAFVADRYEAFYSLGDPHEIEWAQRVIEQCSSSYPPHIRVFMY